MAKPNYSFAKRQRDLAKEQKKEEKLQRKKAAVDEDGVPTEGSATDDVDAPQGETAAANEHKQDTPHAE